MGKKNIVAKQVKKAAKPKAAKPKKATPKSKPVISKTKPPASKGKAAKAKTPKPSKRSLAEPQTALASDDKYGKVKALLGQLDDEELENLWLNIYGYGDEVTEEHVPEDSVRLIGDLADAVSEVNLTPEQMTPQGLRDLLEAY